MESSVDPSMEVVNNQLTKAERWEKIQRYLEKKKWRKSAHSVRYACWRKLANSRIRYKGKFVKLEEVANLDPGSI